MFVGLATKIAGTLLTSLLTEKFLMRVAVILLDKLVKSTSNSLDDKLMAEVKKALDTE